MAGSDINDTVGRIRDLLLSQSKAGRLRSLLDSVYGSAPVSTPGMLGMQHQQTASQTDPALERYMAGKESAARGVPLEAPAFSPDDLIGSGLLKGLLSGGAALGGIIKSGDFLRRHPDFASSAISKNGDLIPGYHATNKDFDAFDPSKSRNNAVYFSTKPEVVEGMQYGGGEGGRTIASYVNLKNPAPYTMYEELRKKYGTRGVVDELKKLGYDGVGVEPRSGFFMAFDNNQIKSAISD